MNGARNTKISKFLSLVLRHKPNLIGLELDAHGWANTWELLEKANLHQNRITFEELKEVVANCEKQRFAFTADFSMIRANQGHSVSVDLELQTLVPPEILYHGTAKRNLESIRTKGLIKGKRHHVHLSSEKETAMNVGQRYGNPVVLIIESGKMHRDGQEFFRSENGVWLTDLVLPRYIKFPL